MADHPFYTEDGEWVEAADLKPGDDIRTLDGDTGEVEAVLFLERTQPMYNLTVAEAHTFFVGDGQWLVHNTGSICDVADDADDDLVDLYHGTKNFEGDEFSLQKAIKHQRDTHLTDRKNPGIFFTDDPGRAATSYGRGGKTIKVRVPKSVADRVRQEDLEGRAEWVFREQPDIDLLNKHIEIKDSPDAIIDWWLKKKKP